MTREEYSALHGLNFSTIKHLLRGPGFFKHALANPVEETSFMRVGTAIHSRILEGKDLSELYAVKPEGMSFTTKDGKAWRDSQVLPIITHDEFTAIQGMERAILNHKVARELLNVCSERETGLTGEIGGRNFKALLDASSRAGVILDLKKVQDAREHVFQSTVQERHYDLQFYLYDRLYGGGNYCAWIAVEERAPHGLEVWTMTPDLLASGEEKFERCIRILEECERTGEWPPYPLHDEPRALGLPQWRKNEISGRF